MAIKIGEVEALFRYRVKSIEELTAEDGGAAAILAPVQRPSDQSQGWDPKG